MRGRVPGDCIHPPGGRDFEPEKMLYIHPTNASIAVPASRPPGQAVLRPRRSAEVEELYRGQHRHFQIGRFDSDPHYSSRLPPDHDCLKRAGMNRPRFRSLPRRCGTVPRPGAAPSRDTELRSDLCVAVPRNEIREALDAFAGRPTPSKASSDQGSKVVKTAPTAGRVNEAQKKQRRSGSRAEEPRVLSVHADARGGRHVRRGDKEFHDALANADLSRGITAWPAPWRR